jgi:hypothetical protein
MTAKTKTLRETVAAAFNRLAREGVAAFRAHDAQARPELSHVCLKFRDMAAYHAHVEAAQGLGPVTREIFNGKEISWCRLDAPLRGNGLTLEYIEFVEPRAEQHDTDGVSSIGFAVPALDAPVKLPSADPGVIFRYQKNHARDLMPKA